MYTSYFGLSEAPFSISPDPRFLYMSKRHREAMAHLIFGIRQGGGFVQLTGEVGTGKTTLCRCLLQQLPENIDVALIINPHISDAELLATLCDEFKIEYPENATPKVLWNILNKHLLGTYAKGKRTVLVIDEAQLLTRAVLEQVRILTNLETTTQKLLQIILIGQPELSDTLNRGDLRQLAQRITARYHLEPLNLEDTREYVRYRLRVAGCDQQLFSDRALRHVYRYTGGVPRLINVICDRSLLGAYTTNARKVSASIVRNAAGEVLGDLRTSKSRWSWAPVAALMLVAAILFWAVPQSRDYMARMTGQAKQFIVGAMDAAMGFSRQTASGQAPMRIESDTGLAATGARIGGRERGQTEGDLNARLQSAESDSEAGAQSEERELEVDAVKPILTVAPLDVGLSGKNSKKQGVELLSTLTSYTNDYQQVFESLVTKWKPESLIENVPLDCDQIEHLGLKCLSKYGTWNNLRNYNRVALLTLQQGGAEFAVLLTRLSAEDVTVQIAKTEHTYSTEELEKYWHGKYVLLWRPPTLEYDEISMVSKGPDVLWLRQALNRVAQIDGSEMLDVMRSDYDEELQERVITFQKNHDIEANGIVGADTLIRLNTLLNETDLPLLSQAPTG